MTKLKQRQKPWTKILLVINVGSPEKRSNQPNIKNQKLEVQRLLQLIRTTCIVFT